MHNFFATKNFAPEILPDFDPPKMGVKFDKYALNAPWTKSRFSQNFYFFVYTKKKYFFFEIFFKKIFHPAVERDEQILHEFFCKNFAAQFCAHFFRNLQNFVKFCPKFTQNLTFSSSFRTRVPPGPEISRRAHFVHFPGPRKLPKNGHFLMFFANETVMIPHFCAKFFDIFRDAQILQNFYEIFANFFRNFSKFFKILWKNHENFLFFSRIMNANTEKKYLFFCAKFRVHTKFVERSNGKNFSGLAIFVKILTIFAKNCENFIKNSQNLRIFCPGKHVRKARKSPKSRTFFVYLYIFCKNLWKPCAQFLTNLTKFVHFLQNLCTFVQNFVQFLSNFWQIFDKFLQNFQNFSKKNIFFQKNVQKNTLIWLVSSSKVWGSKFFSQKKIKKNFKKILLQKKSQNLAKICPDPHFFAPQDRPFLLTIGTQMLSHEHLCAQLQKFCKKLHFFRKI